MGSLSVHGVVEWAEAEESVRAAILVGSRGELRGQPDQLSDNDLLLFFRDPERYEVGQEWLTAFGTVLVKLDEEYDVLGSRVVTRLVQYAEGHRIDFSNDSEA